MKKFILVSLCLLLLVPVAQAKKSKSASSSNSRVQNLSSSDQEMFDALTKDQQKNIREGRIETGYNAWMIILALGNPYYRTEHHPIYVDFEEVWLYVKDQIQKQDSQEKIQDPRTNWPTIHKKFWTKTCKVGDFFVLFDRGVAAKILKDDSGKTYGSCEIKTSEEFIPIVDD